MHQLECGVTTGEGSVLYCSAGGQSYTLAVGDTGEAHSWIRKLQDKREQWIRRDSAQGMTDLDRQAKKKVLQPLHERVGVVLPDTGLWLLRTLTLS